MLGRGASTGGTTAPPPTLPLVGYAPFTFRRCARAFRGSSGSPSASNLSELVPIERAPSLSSRGTGFASTSFDPSRRASVESMHRSFWGGEDFQQEIDTQNSRDISLFLVSLWNFGKKVFFLPLRVEWKFFSLLKLKILILLFYCL